MRPPFFFVLPKKNVPCPVRFKPAGPYLVRYTLLEQRTAAPHLVTLVRFRGWSSDLARFWPRAFRFATRCRSLSPGGKSKGKEPQPIPLCHFKGVQG